MKVVMLLENRTISRAYRNKHGLSMYIETANHRILFDTGSGKDFAVNAKKLGVSLQDIDTVILSHGHIDHGGGLENFLKLNNKAKIYVGYGAFEKHYMQLFGIKFNIGLKKRLAFSSGVEFVSGVLKIDEELTVFGKVKGNTSVPVGKGKLLRQYRDGSIKRDDFEDEINLLVKEKDSYNLFCGCAHRGIHNIIERSKEITGCDLHTVVGGFHLKGMKLNDPNTLDFLDELSEKLKVGGMKYYTCHCTGKEAYNYLSKTMSTLKDVKTGMTIEI